MNKNIILVTRMFSGLFATIEKKEWNPTGILAFINLAERIETEINVLNKIFRGRKDEIQINNFR